MKPFDPRLMKYARDTRFYIGFLVILGLISTGLIAVQTLLIAGAASPVFYGKGLDGVFPLILGLAGVFLLRGLLDYVQQAVGHRSALKIIADLRTKVLRRAGDLGDRWLSAGNTSPVVTLVTRGIDDLEAYFVQFLPQLFLTVTATPALLAVILYLDWISALLIVGCIPLIPIFMILIGKMTSRYSNQRLAAMQKLGAQLLDLLAGLSTLKALGREQGPKARVRKLGDNFAERTMQTLYVAFLSGAALEFLTTLSTALVAVSVGFRMVDGSILLFEGLVIIMLTPEVFKPLREVGTQFHASSDGVTAAQNAFDIIETPLPTHPGTERPAGLAHAPIVFADVSVYAPGRATVAPHQLTATITPGTVTVLRGPSGSGKTTAVSCLLGLLQPDEGTILLGDTPLARIDLDYWWKHITWVPQRPAIVPGTVLANIDHPHDGALERAARITGFADVVHTLPDGWQTVIGHGGTGLSVGQRQRLALTRALVSSRQIIVLDEPSAHLDAAAETYVLDAVRELKAAGHTVIVVAHREAILGLADHIIDVSAAERDISFDVAKQREARAASEINEEIAAGKLDYAVPTSWTQGSTGSGEARKPRSSTTRKEGK